MTDEGPLVIQRYGTPAEGSGLWMVNGDPRAEKPLEDLILYTNHITDLEFDLPMFTPGTFPDSSGNQPLRGYMLEERERLRGDQMEMKLHHIRLNTDSLSGSSNSIAGIPGWRSFFMRPNPEEIIIGSSSSWVSHYHLPQYDEPMALYLLRDLTSGCRNCVSV